MTKSQNIGQILKRQYFKIHYISKTTNGCLYRKGLTLYLHLYSFSNITYLNEHLLCQRGLD